MKKADKTPITINIFSGNKISLDWQIRCDNFNCHRMPDTGYIIL